MVDIAYRNLAGTMLRINVRLDGRYVGQIRGGPNGFYYRASGGPNGELFQTIAEVKASLETPEQGA